MGAEVAAGRRGGRRTAATRVPGSRADEHGAVTAEAAAVLPVLVAAVLGLVWLVALAASQVRAVDAARDVARLVARGEAEAAAVQHGQQVAPQGARIAVTRGGERVRVTVAAAVGGPGGLFAFFPGVEVQAQAVAVAEER